VNEVFLARHGQTEWNRARRVQGQLDSPLTPEGIVGTRSAADRLHGFSIDGVFSSPLGRAHSTAQLYAEALGLPVVTVAELAEIHHGTLAGLSREEIESAFPGEMARRDADKYRWQFPGGESYAEADVRAAEALRVVDESGAARPLLVSHEMIGRMLLRNLLDLPPDQALAYRQPNEVVYRIDVGAGSVQEIRA
jgi:broad specificity phosphatase PhoE